MASNIATYCDSMILSDLTCSLCRNLYDTPKMMPNCAHSFCLKCLQQLKIEGVRPFAIVVCPECNTASIVADKGVEDFATNYVAQKISDKMRKATLQPAPSGQPLEDGDDGTVCTHLTELSETCRHCCQLFCRNCKYRHMERIKEDVADIIKAHENLTSRQISVDELVDHVDRILQNDIERVRVELDSATQQLLIGVVNLLRGKVKQLSESAAKLVDLEIVRLRNLAASFNANSGQKLADIKDRIQRMATTSVFKQQLDDFATLFLEIANEKEAISTFQNLHPLINDSTTEMLKLNATANGALLAAFEEVQLGTIECWLKNKEAVFESLTIAPSPDSVHPVQQMSETVSETSTDATDAPSAPIPKDEPLSPQPPVSEPASSEVKSESEEKTASELKTEEFSEEKKIRQKPRLFRNVAEFAITPYVTRIIALPTQGLFAILSVSKAINRITLYQPSGEIVNAVDILKPDPRFKSFFVDEIATDYREGIFATAVFRDEAGRKGRAICRFWINEGGACTVPALFVIGHDGLSNTFKGIAISAELQLVFTTEADAIVAYESTNLPRYQIGWQVARWYLGPNPYLHSVGDDFEPYYSLKLVCSNNGDELFSWTMYPSGGAQRLARISEREIYCKPLPFKSAPTQLCVWNDGIAIVCKDGVLCKYVNIHQFPELVNRYPAGLSNERKRGIKNLAVLPTVFHARPKCYIGMLYDKNVAFAEMKDL